MNKARIYRWAGLVFGTSATAFAVEGCVLQELLGGILGSITGA